MTDYFVVPHSRVGPVQLGVAREESRAAMSGMPHTFCGAPGSQHGTDAWHNNAFQVSYAGDPPSVEYIELSAGGRFRALYKGTSVFESPSDELLALVSRDAPYDGDDPELGYSYTFRFLDLSLWRPVMPESPDDPEGHKFATIGIGIEGYYARGSV